MRGKHPVQASLDVLQESWRKHVHVKRCGREKRWDREKEYCLGLRKKAFMEDKKEETKV